MHNMHMFIPHSRNFPAFNNSDVEELKGFLIRFNYHYFVDRFSVWRNFFSRFSPQGSLSVMMQERAIAFLGISFEQMKPHTEMRESQQSRRRTGRGDRFERTATTAAGAHTVWPHTTPRPHRNPS